MTETASSFVPWLRALAEGGGKGVVGNIDARCLGRLADGIDDLSRQLAEAQGVTERMRTALLKLTNEVAGLSAFEIELRECISNTNVNCLFRRVDEARVALALPMPAQSAAKE